MTKYITSISLFLIFFTLTVKANENLPSFSALAEEASPAVVKISSSKTIKSGNERDFGPRGFNDPF